MIDEFGFDVCVEFFVIFFMFEVILWIIDVEIYVYM